MSSLREFSYPSSDQIHTVHAREWLPDGPVGGVVQIVHGLSEHMGRYETVARFFNEHGFLVCGEDHLGHGKTVDDGKFGYFGPEGGWELVLRDVRRLREIQGEKYPGVPYVMLGHSMGSFLTRTYLIRWPGDLDGAVLSGTGQEPAAVVAFGKAVSGLLCKLRGADHRSVLVYALSLGAYNKQFKPNRTPSDWLSRDEAAVDAFRKDQLCRFLPTCGLFRDMLGGLQGIAKKTNLARMDKETPVYFFSGGQDPVGAQGRGVEKVAAMFRAAGCKNVSVKLYPGGRHEMFHEINRQEAMENLLKWLEENIYI